MDKNLTVIFIAHRLSTIKSCNYIYQFENGQIKASGDYEKLIKTSSSFREMIYSSKKSEDIFS